MNILQKILPVLVIVFAEVGAAGQERVRKSETVYGFTENYEVLKSDTTIRDGGYTKVYKNRVVEKGRYAKGRRVGTWEFTNDMKMVELRYNYTIGQPLYILPHEGKAYSQDTYPCMFLGSSMVPFFFIMYNVYYPKAEADNVNGGKVVLSLHIDANGYMTGFDIESATTENFARVVRQAAQKMPADKWRWAPAMLNGTAIADDYNMTIMFDN